MPGDPELPLADVQEVAGPEVECPGGRVPDHRLGSAGAPSFDHDVPALGQLAGREAEEEELVLVLDLAHPDEDLGRVRDARVCLHLRVEALREHRARQVGGALLEEPEVRAADVDQLVRRALALRCDREQRDDQPDPDRDPRNGERRAHLPPQQVLAARARPRSRRLSSHWLGSTTMEPDREAILKALEHVIDPELKRPVTELDMVRDVEIEGGDVSVTIALTVAGCPLRSSFQDQVTRARRRRPRRRARPARVRRDEPRGEDRAVGQAPRRRRPSARRESPSTARRACSRSRAARAASASPR